jgi:5,6,7,8-tetrahydromethanopterin hydro-lyase
VAAVPVTTQIGESFVGEGVNAAHVNTVLGELGGPVETAWATALATPRAGHAAFVATVVPGIAVRPFTLFVNKAPIVDQQHGRLTWGPAQAGVAAGVMDAVAEGVVAEDAAGHLLLIAAVWVNPSADDTQAVYENNRRSAHDALQAGSEGRPLVADALDARHHPYNAFFDPPSAVP